MRLTVVTLIAVALSATAAVSAERREHEAHEHGHATMHVVLEGETLAIELEAPGMDIVGFEHAAKSKADKFRVRGALEMLEDTGEMFSLPKKAECTLSQAHAEVETIETEGQHEHQQKEDGGAKEDHADGDGGHNSFHARYEWRCARPAALEGVQVHYFRHFSGTEEIEAIVLGPNGQTATELTADAPDIRF